jgi:hypothetical protein
VLKGTSSPELCQEVAFCANPIAPQIPASPSRYGGTMKLSISSFSAGETMYPFSAIYTFLRAIWKKRPWPSPPAFLALPPMVTLQGNRTHNVSHRIGNILRLYLPRLML